MYDFESVAILIVDSFFKYLLILAKNNLSIKRLLKCFFLAKDQEKESKFQK